MPTGHPIKACKACGRPVYDRSELTYRGYHVECGARVQRDYIDSLIAHSGPGFDHWRRRSLAALGVNVLDDGTLNV
jgi:hypothetical protein